MANKVKMKGYTPNPLLRSLVLVVKKVATTHSTTPSQLSPGNMVFLEINHNYNIIYRTSMKRTLSKSQLCTSTLCIELKGITSTSTPKSHITQINYLNYSKSQITQINYINYSNTTYWQQHALALGLPLQTRKSVDLTLLSKTNLLGTGSAKDLLGRSKLLHQHNEQNQNTHTTW